MKTLIEKLKTFLYSFFKYYWEETTIRINDREVIELGGFVICMFILIGSMSLLDHFGFINVF